MECSTGKKVVYLDNNATTLMPQRVVQRMVEWINKGNPSADYKSAKDCRELMKCFRRDLATKCDFKSYEPDDKSENKNQKWAAREATDRSEGSSERALYHVIFTSCASESNNMFVRAVVESYNSDYSRDAKNKTPPHIILSSVEHKSILNCAVQLAKRGCTELTLIRPDKFGFIHAKDVKSNIRPNTILISIMQANNETGAINDIEAISAVAKSHGAVFHTDCVQSFSKFLLRPVVNGNVVID